MHGTGCVRANLDSIIRASRDELRNRGPAVAELGVVVQDGGILLARPGLLFDRGVQVVVPAFAALLAQATFQLGGDGAPEKKEKQNNNNNPKE